MAINIDGFRFGTDDGSSELAVSFKVEGEAEGIKLLTSIRSLLVLLAEDPERVGKRFVTEEPPALAAAPVVEAAPVAPVAAAPAEPVRQAKRTSKPPAPAPIEAPGPAPAPAVAPVAARPVVETVTPPLAAAPAPVAAAAPVAPAPKAAVQRAPEPAAAPAPAAAPVQAVTGPVPGLPEVAPAEVVEAKSFRSVVVWFLTAGVSDPEVVLAACTQWRSQVPIIDKMMQPQTDPEAEIGPRIRRAIEVIKAGK